MIHTLLSSETRSMTSLDEGTLLPVGATLGLASDRDLVLAAAADMLLPDRAGGGPQTALDRNLVATVFSLDAMTSPGTGTGLRGSKTIRT